MSEGEEKIFWKESNLALIGSDLDKKIKQAAAGGEDAWQAISDSPGVMVWRIEQFKIVPWPKGDYGCFYAGDSYIVLNSYLIEDRLYRDLYIWIGSESSQDEYGTAAYKVNIHMWMEFLLLLHSITSCGPNAYDLGLSYCHLTS